MCVCVRPTCRYGDSRTVSSEQVMCGASTWRNMNLAGQPRGWRTGGGVHPVGRSLDYYTRMRWGWVGTELTFPSVPVACLRTDAIERGHCTELTLPPVPVAFLRTTFSPIGGTSGYCDSLPGSLGLCWEYLKSTRAGYDCHASLSMSWRWGTHQLRNKNSAAQSTAQRTAQSTVQAAVWSTVRRCQQSAQNVPSSTQAKGNRDYWN